MYLILHEQLHHWQIKAEQALKGYWSVFCLSYSYFEILKPFTVMFCKCDVEDSYMYNVNIS